MDKQIPLTRGKFATVNHSDYKWLNRWRWHAIKNHHVWYAVRNSLCKNGKRTNIYMHREILGLKFGDLRQGDHRNGNGLDNKRENLRIATNTQNQHNRRPQKGASRFKGVSWKRQTEKWQAQICVSGQLMHLGYFDNEIEAAKTYDRVAKIFFGKFAYVNLKKG